MEVERVLVMSLNNFSSPQREATNFRKDGCLAVRQSLLDKMRARTAPGPIYNPKPRVSSREKSIRNVTFGTGPARYNDEPTHNKRRVPKTCYHPGPQTYCPSAIQNAIYMQSKEVKTAGIKFGTGKRDCNTENKSTTPSPAEYDPEMIRKGIMFSKKGSTCVKFGTAVNNDLKPCEKPGPQTYNPEAIRKGIMFTKSTMPSVKFGNPPKKEEGRKTSTIPGPQEYDTENIRRGLYAMSTHRKPPGVRFTSGRRTYNDDEERERASKPGPNAYDIPSALGKQYSSKYKSQPCISFGSR